MAKIRIRRICHADHCRTELPIHLDDVRHCMHAVSQSVALLIRYNNAFDLDMSRPNPVALLPLLLLLPTLHIQVANIPSSVAHAPHLMELSAPMWQHVSWTSTTHQGFDARRGSRDCRPPSTQKRTYSETRRTPPDVYQHTPVYANTWRQVKTFKGIQNDCDLQLKSCDRNVAGTAQRS